MCLAGGTQRSASDRPQDNPGASALTLVSFACSTGMCAICFAGTETSARRSDSDHPVSGDTSPSPRRAWLERQC